MRHYERRGAQLPHFAPLPRTGYEALQPTHNEDATAAYEDFKRELLPALTEIHGGDLRSDDPEYLRAWWLFLQGFNRGHVRGQLKRHVEELQETKQ
jgi:hypothetical protein